MSENFSDELKELDDRIEEVVRWQELAEEYSDVADDSGTFVLLDKLNTLELELLTQKHRTIEVARWACLSIVSVAIAVIVLASPTLTGWLGNLLAADAGLCMAYSLWKLWNVNNEKP